MKAPICEFLIASCVRDGGVLRFALEEDGTVRQTQKIDLPSPMWLNLTGGRLWVTLNDPFADSTDSGVTVIDPASGKVLVPLVSTRGAVGCHAETDGTDFYCANYVGGSVFKYPETVRKHTGHGKNPVRQQGPHPHSVFFSPDRKFLLCCDLGLDTVFVLDRDLREMSRASVPAGEGPRHLVFSRDGRFVYCLTEMGASICVFAWENGKLNFLDSVKLLKESEAGKGAAIRLSHLGDLLWVTERATETLFTFAVKDAELTRLSAVSTHGREPRDFLPLADERFAVCANQFGNNLTVYRLDHGIPAFLGVYPVPAPLCIVEI